MSENDAKRFIAENTRDRRPSMVDISDKFAAAYFGSPSRKPVVTVSNGEDHSPDEPDDMDEADYGVVVNARTGAINYPRNEPTEGTCQTCDGAGDGPDGTCWACSGSGITKY